MIILVEFLDYKKKFLKIRQKLKNDLTIMVYSGYIFLSW